MRWNKKYIISEKDIYWKWLIRLFLTVFIFLSPMLSVAQIIYMDGKPDLLHQTLEDEILEDLSFDMELIDSLRKSFRQKNGRSTFAVKMEVSYKPSNSGQVITNSYGENVWYLRIRSKGALTMNIIFKKFELTEGEKVYVYDKEGLSIRGPFTNKNNKSPGSLAVMPVKGEELIIEYHQQKNRSKNNLLEVGQVAHDFIGILNDSGSKDVYFGNSQPCNEDINCSIGEDWQSEKNSVVRIIAGGTELGSGFMLNNTNQENIPYLLTANHVIKSSSYAINSIYVFRYESPYCDGPDGWTEHTLSGAELISSESNMDFSLVRLSEFPPITYKPYLAGWDVSATIPDNQITIHHPSGDVKKISIDNDSPVIDTFNDSYENGFWKILQWDIGTTEGGSSGSPLFNQDHRVVGLLTGGEAVCGNSVNDYFARIDIAYDVSENIYESLMPWLNPARSGTYTLDGRDPYSENYLSVDTLSNFSGQTGYLTGYISPGTGYTSGFNSDSIIMYAEHFHLESPKDLIEVIMELGDVELISSLDSVSLFIMTGNTEPETILSRRIIFIREVLDSTSLSFDFLNPVPLNTDFFIAWRLWYHAPALSDPQQFAVFHSNAASNSENSSFYMDGSGWHPFYENDENALPANLFVSAVMAETSTVNPVEKVSIQPGKLTIFPNPARDIISIKGNGMLRGRLEYQITNISGHYYGSGVLEISETSDSQISLNGLSSGIYILRLRNSDINENHRIIIAK